MRTLCDFDASFWYFEMLGEGGNESGISRTIMWFGVKINCKGAVGISNDFGLARTGFNENSVFHNYIVADFAL